MRRPAEAHWQWSEEPALTYWPAGTYRLGRQRISSVESRQIVRRSRIDRGPEARWRWHLEPPRLEYYADGRFTVGNKFATRDQAQWVLAEQLADTGVGRLEWNIVEMDPPRMDLADDSEDVQVELSTARLSLKEVERRYDEQGERESSDLDEERDYPVDPIPEDAEEEARLAWSHFETWVADDTAFGRWLGRAKGLPCLISYYLVAHRVVYAEGETVQWGEVIRTRYVPFGRGDGYTELKSRVQQMKEKSDDEVVFVAAGVKILFKETFG